MSNSSRRIPHAIISGYCGVQVDVGHKECFFLAREPMAAGGEEESVVKQTGPLGGVKRLAPILVVAAAAALAGCAAAWTHPSRTAAETRADMDECDRTSEEDALMRAGRARGDYGMPPSGPTPGGYGPSPMQMHDRDAVVQDFRGAFDKCMESKGYQRGKPKP